MSVKDICFSSGGVLLLLLSLVQIAPIKINPWSAILGWFGEKTNQKLSCQLNNLEKVVDGLITDVDTVKEEGRERQAKQSRTQILRFADEIYQGRLHSKEHYEQIILEIGFYDAYCEAHERFSNQITITAAKVIKENYEKHLKEHSFLQ